MLRHLCPPSTRRTTLVPKVRHWKQRPVNNNHSSCPQMIRCRTLESPELYNCLIMEQFPRATADNTRRSSTYAQRTGSMARRSQQLRQLKPSSRRRNVRGADRSTSTRSRASRDDELRDHLLQIQAEVVARLVDRQMLGLRHATSDLGGVCPPDPPKVKGSRNQSAK